MLKYLVTLFLLIPSLFAYDLATGTLHIGNYTPSASYIDTSTYLSRGAAFTGAANGKTGLLSFWIKTHSSGNVERILVQSGLTTLVYKQANGTVRIQAYDYFAPTLELDMQSTSSVEGGVWHHVAMMWDVADVSKCKIYVDGTEGTTNTITIGTLDLNYTQSNWYISDAVLSLNSDISELYFAPNQWLNLATSITAFRSSNGYPVSIGATGATPTGTAPILYLKDTYTSWQTNSGTGGNLTVTSGTIQSATPPP